MGNIPCPSIASMLTHGQQITHRAHHHGWIEAPNGRLFQPKATEVKFIKGCRVPFISRPRNKRRWFTRLMGIFA
ncbi:MAG: phage filamentation protein Fil family protein [Rouxiella badensis]|uniref:phage filamentation protein Fil family protein n=1 Tax=Rouxiella badensis TaxID=1646377 RepID=UPI003C474B87